MRKVVILFLFAIVLCMAACRPSTVTVVTEVRVLRASSIYDRDSVYLYMQKYKDTNKEIAASYYNKGIELENTNLPKAIYCVKRSITLQPALNKYRELGSLLYKAGTYEELEQVYNTIIRGIDYDHKDQYLFGKPSEDLVCEYVTYNILAFEQVWNSYGDNEGEMDGLTKEIGIDVKDVEKKVLSDKRIKLDTNSEGYKNILLQFLSDSEMTTFMKTESSFKFFLSSIKDTSSVFEIAKDSVAEFDYTLFHEMASEIGPDQIAIDNLYRVYLPEGKGDHWPDYNYRHRVKINDSINVVLYAIDTSEIACPREMRHIYYKLITYGKKANRISDVVVANQSGEQLSTMKYNHGLFTVTYYKRTWEKPYKKDDFNNHIQNIEMTGEKIFQIKQDGKIYMLPVSANQKAL